MSPSQAARVLAASLVLAVPAIVPAALAQQANGSFRDGACSGLLCSYIGGSQAPAAQQKPLFREGECGGVLCETIGGSQAPKHAEPPPNCGGGLLCDLMPYRMGASLGAAAPAPAEARQDAAASPAPAAPTKAGHRGRKASKATKPERAAGKPAKADAG